MAINVENVDFLFECEGELTKEKYVGKFTCRQLLTSFQKSAADFDRRSFLGQPGQNEQISEDVATMAFVLSQLKARIVSGPLFWKETNFLKDLVDENVSLELYKKCLEVETKFRENLVSKAEKVKEEMIKEDKPALKI